MTMKIRVGGGGLALLATLALTSGSIALAAEASPSPAAVEATAPAAQGSAVSISAGERDIPGVLALPTDGEGPFPAVLLLHGYGSDKHEVGMMYSRLADALAARGVASLRIDFAGMGESQASMLDYTYDSQTADAATAYEWLLSQESIDPARVGVHGFSMGATIASHLAGTEPRVAALGSWSGAIYDGDRYVYDEATLAECEEAGQITLDLGFRTIDHSCEFFSSMMGSSALTDVASFSGPLLLIAGSEDTVVPPSVSENAATATASEDVTLHVIEGADHIYLVLTEDQALAEEAITVTADWYAEKL